MLSARATLNGQGCQRAYALLQQLIATLRCSFTPIALCKRREGIQGHKSRRPTPDADCWSACATDMPQAAHEGAKGRKAGLESGARIGRPTATGRRLIGGTAAVLTKSFALAPRLRREVGRHFFYGIESSLIGWGSASLKALLLTLGWYHSTYKIAFNLKAKASTVRRATKKAGGLGFIAE